MKQLRTAVVGVGALGRHHARIISTLEQTRLVAVAEINADVGRAMAEQYKADWVGDYRDLLERIDIDAVVVAVPTFAHYEVVSQFLGRGIPVFVEKPIAAGLEEAEKLVDLADRQEVILQVGHVERFNPAFEVAADQCESPKYIRAERVSPFTFRSTDIGVVHDLMIHDLELVQHLAAAPVTDVQAFGFGLMGTNEDTVQARLTFANGCIADLTASRLCPVAKRAMQIWSASGCVIADLASREVITYAPSNTLLFGTSPVQLARETPGRLEELKQNVFGDFIGVETHEVSDADALTAELESFAVCVLEGRQPLVGGTEALQAMRVADQVLQSVANHAWDGSAAGRVGPFPQHATTRRKAG